MDYATHAIVDLDVLAGNLAAIGERVGSALILVAVKANAYGHGAVQVSRLIQRTRAADWLAVATVPEAVELRAAGIGLPILKLSHVFAEELPSALAADLTLTVVDEQTVREASAAAAVAWPDEPRRRAAVHLKIDTGMRRIGISPGRAAALARIIEDDPRLKLQGVFTHLAASDTPAEDEFTRTQLTRFADAVTAIQDDLGRRIEIVHAANSGAVLAHPEAWFDMVRPGIMVYGYYPDATTPRTVAVRPVLSLESRVSLVKQVEPDETVSYGRTWRSARETTIATVPVGYADGYPRSRSSNGDVLIAGRRHPIAGRVCMDQLMVDVGPNSGVQPGDRVVLIGSSGGQTITADEVAASAGTISYEILTSIAPRVTRIYRPAPEPDPRAAASSSGATPTVAARGASPSSGSGGTAAPASGGTAEAAPAAPLPRRGIARYAHLMLRPLIRLGIFLVSAAVGLWLASLIVSGMNLRLFGLGFIVAVVVFSVAQSLLTPWLFKVSRSKAPAFIGGVGLISTFLALFIATLIPSSNLTITGVGSWLMATLVVWLVTALGAWLLPLWWLKEKKANRAS